MGHGDYAVMTTGEIDKGEVIVECPSREIAEHIIELHNARLPAPADGIRDFLKDIPGFYAMGKKEPLDDLVAYVHTKKAKKQAEQRLAKWDFGVKVEVAVVQLTAIPWWCPCPTWPTAGGGCPDRPDYGGAVPEKLDEVTDEDRALR